MRVVQSKQVRVGFVSYTVLTSHTYNLLGITDR